MPRSINAILSPRDTLLPLLSPDEAVTLPYSPQLLPGSRDVESPYGTMRLYEWGPKEGRKVLLLHGDTTPAPILGPIAHGLGNRGCRVLVIDLWGRGYSDSPLGVQYDTRLFTTQILIALASSPLSWTGDETGGFSIIGYSLGGGIAMAFAAYFPHLINSVVLLGPGGILRSKPRIYDSIFFRFSWLFPSWYLGKLIGRYLGVYFRDLPYDRPTVKDAITNQNNQEMAEQSGGTPFPPSDIPAITRWQVENHKGFIHGFLNTSQNGPITCQHADWARVGALLQDKGCEKSLTPNRLKSQKLLVILGDADDIVRADEFSHDLTSIFGNSSYAEIETVPGTHGFPVPCSQEVVERIWKFWKV